MLADITRTARCARGRGFTTLIGLKHDQNHGSLKSYIGSRHGRREHGRRGHGRKIGQTSRLGWIPSGFTRRNGAEKHAKRRVVAKARPSGESSDYE